MRVLLIGVSLLALGACSKSANEFSTATESDVSTPQPEALPRQPTALSDIPTNSSAPGVAVTAAPGVAFKYDYDFRLPAEKIAAAQEAHASACEKLGLTRCRITGMRYTLRDNGGIDAMLSFKLDPTIARAFGKEGIATIEASEGMLTNAAVAGTDAGGDIDQLARRRAAMASERARIDRELAKPGLTPSERAELQRQRQGLVTQDNVQRADIDEKLDSLAITPMTFEYQSGTAINAFGGKGMIARALDAGTRSVDATIAVVLTLIAVLGPPGLVLIGLFLGGRWVRRRYRLAWPHTATVA